MIRVTPDAIDVSAVIAAVARPEAGATALFLGTVRDHSGGKAVCALEYEAYAPMAEKELARIAAEADARWGARVAIVHRTGRLAVGEVSVAIAASAPHRAEAFDACRWAIDAIKESVPVWKKEFGPDGAEWV